MASFPLLASSTFDPLGSCVSLIPHFPSPPEVLPPSRLSSFAAAIVNNLPALADQARLLEVEERALDARICELEDQIAGFGEGTIKASSRGRKRGPDALGVDEHVRDVRRHSAPDANTLLRADIHSKLPSANSDVFLGHTISLKSRRKGRIFLEEEASVIADGTGKRRKLDGEGGDSDTDMDS